VAIEGNTDFGDDVFIYKDVSVKGSQNLYDTLQVSIKVNLRMLQTPKSKGFLPAAAFDGLADQPMVSATAYIGFV
jgi:hypothetical protein